MIVLLTLACRDPGPVSPPAPDLDAEVAELLAGMTLEEKVAQLHGSGAPDGDGFWTTPDVDRLDLPGFRMSDGPRGLTAGVATTFPVAMARGATFDPDLERRVGQAIGAETAARGGDVLLAPAMNILRHPGWGRAQETYGEDVHHLGVMALAFVEGAQHHVLASAKHFAANSIEDTRADVDVRVSEQALREVYLPHFRKVVQEGRVASVMTAYNQVNGAYCSENAPLLGILKDEWGFDGFVESDWVFGVHSTVPALVAGLDVEMPGPRYFGDALIEAVQQGDVDEAALDGAVTRVLRGKLRRRALEPADPGVIDSPEHRALARRVAEEGMVLLANDGVLPLGPGRTVALVGELASVANLGDGGSSATEPSVVVSPLQGLEDAGVDVTWFADASDLASIAAADVAVVVVGLTGADEGENTFAGEGGDRDALGLSDAHVALIHAVAAVHPDVVVVLEGGSAITVEPWLDEVEAVVMAWYPGEEGGTALASLLTGAIAPSGRLPSTIPVAEGDLPPFDHTSLEVTYGVLHGYRWLADQGTAARFPFGFGLTYTSFALDGLVTPAGVDPDGVVELTVDVHNTGSRDGVEVVQAYVSPVDVPGKARELRAFARVAVSAGATETASLAFPVADLARWADGWVVEPGTYRVDVGSSSVDVAATATFEVR